MFADARHAERELTALTLRIVAEADAWVRKGVAIGGVGPAGDGSGVVVTTPDVQRARELLVPADGAMVIVEDGPAASAPVVS
jgi:hypothetical protein